MGMASRRRREVRDGVRHASYTFRRRHVQPTDLGRSSCLRRTRHSIDGGTAVREIHLAGVTKRYGNHVVAIEDVTLEIAPGEFMVLVGPSGCGKSTLLRIIAGLEELTAGTVMIGDKDVTHMAPQARDVAMVFQSYALYPHMTVQENLAFGLKVRRLGKNEIRERVDSVARMLGLDELLDRRPPQLSGGQRQRVA